MITFSDFEENVNYRYNDIYSIQCSNFTNSPAECLELCKQTWWSCIGFSWHSPQHDYCPKSCWLKSKMENRRFESNVISGFVNIVNEGSV